MKVKSIEYAGKADVYNMEVEDTHDYIVNGGIVSHNCYDEQRYLFMEHPLNPRQNEAFTPPAEDPLNLWADEHKYIGGRGIYA